MSSLQQKRSQMQSQQKGGGTVMQTGTWAKVFPKQQNTATKSCTFVKKLMAVAISNITYLRSIFPENVFSNRSLDGLPLKILKEDSGCEAATGLVNWLRGAFEALEKRYLRELIFIIYMNPEDSNEIHEMYTFRFGYSEGDRAECHLLQGTDKKRVHSVTDEDLYKATVTLLRTIIVLVQGLGPLPDSAYMTMKLTYYDEITPADYEPPGFCHTEWTSPKLPSGAVSLNSGDVSTNFHTLKLRVKAVPLEISIKDKDETEDKTVAITNSFSVSESEFETKGKSVDKQKSDYMVEKGESSLRNDKDMQPIDLNTTLTMPNKAAGVADGDTVKESLSLLSDNSNTQLNGYDIKCICQSIFKDSLMLECIICHTFHHGACYRIIFQSDIPAKHVCASCSLEDEKQICTDRKLAKHFKTSNNAVSRTCLFRRALACLLDVKTITISYLREALGINLDFAEGIMVKLVEEKIVNDPESGEYNIDEEVFRLTSLPKFLGIKRFKQMNYTEEGIEVLNTKREINKAENDNLNEIKKGNLKEDSNVIKPAKDTVNEVNKKYYNIENITMSHEKIFDKPIRTTRAKKREVNVSIQESKTSKRTKRFKVKASTVEESDQLI